jgi:transcription factor SPN1
MEARTHQDVAKGTRFLSDSRVLAVFSSFLPFYLASKQTLDALPSHLLTPFNGPVPPSNLLDKIARGVAEAKGPADWPHSQRATRAKIVELAQHRTRDNTPIAGIAEESGEEDEPREILRPSSRINRRRALYRQSSMDFIPDDEANKKDNIKDNQSINRSVRH